MKSSLVAIILTLLFGPLGVFYASVKWGVVHTLGWTVVAIITLGFGLAIYYPLTAIHAARLVDHHNARRG